MKDMNKIAIRKQLTQFGDALKAGIDGLVKAGKIYVKAIDENPLNAGKFRDEFADWVPDSAWSNFEAIGRGWLHPRLVMGGISDRQKTNTLKRLPYSIQEQVFEHKRFPLLTSDGDTLQIDVLDATRSQIDQLCDGSNGIRTLSAQLAYIESKKAEGGIATAETMPYVIRGNSVVFKRNVRLTKDEVSRILKDM